MSGLFYTAGRVIVYIALGAAITAGLMATGEVSRFLQKYLNEILGPVLILLGMVLLGMIGSGLSFNIAGGKIQDFAFLIAFGGEMLGKAFDRLTHIELWVRRITGIIFILAGIYYCLTHIYGLNLRG